MPFKRQSDGSYRSPSGRKMTGAQVRAYYAKQKGKGKRQRRHKKKGRK